MEVKSITLNARAYSAQLRTTKELFYSVENILYVLGVDCLSTEPTRRRGDTAKEQVILDRQVTGQCAWTAYATVVA